MSDIKLFRLIGGTATELQGSASDLEKPLQTLIEANLQPLLNIRFIATEPLELSHDKVEIQNRETKRFCLDWLKARYEDGPGADAVGKRCRALLSAYQQDPPVILQDTDPQDVSWVPEGADRRVVLHAQRSAEGFYARQGFAVRGEPFNEVDIPHIEMARSL